MYQAILYTRNSFQQVVDRADAGEPDFRTLILTMQREVSRPFSYPFRIVHVSLLMDNFRILNV